MTLSPRDTFAQLASMYGYDPATVISVNADQDEVIISFRLTNPSGGFTVTDHGFLMTDTTRASLDAMAQAYGYNPGQVVGVWIGRYESRVIFRVTREDGVTLTLEQDSFRIPEPAVPPTIATTDPGVAPA